MTSVAENSQTQSKEDQTLLRRSRQYASKYAQVITVEFAQCSSRYVGPTGQKL